MILALNVLGSRIPLEIYWKLWILAQKNAQTHKILHINSQHCGPLLETYLWSLVLKISNLDKTNEKQHKIMLWSGAKLTVYVWLCVNWPWMQKGLLESGKHCYCLWKYDAGVLWSKWAFPTSLTMQSSRKWLSVLASNPKQLHIRCLSRYPINTVFEINTLEFLTWAPRLCCPVKSYHLCVDPLVRWETHQGAAEAA